MSKKFSKGEAIRFGFDTTKDNIVFFVAVLVVAGLINAFPELISGLFGESAFLLFLFSVASWVLSVVVQMGLINISLKFCDNQKSEFGDLFSCYPLFLNYLVASILYGLIVLFGLVLLVVPGIIWAIKFQFFGYLIVDKGFGPLEALKKSSQITDGVKWDLFLFGLLLWLINVVGALFLLVGLFVTIPTAMLAVAFVYRKLLEQTESRSVSESLIEP